MSHGSRHLVHTSRQSIRWGDMDALGHVNNTVYFRYMEQARIEWLSKLQEQLQAPDVVSAGGHATVIVNASCTFLQPLTYPGEIEVRMLLGEPGRTSINSYYEVRCREHLYAEGAAKIVWIDLASGRPTPLPPPLAARLSATAGQ